MTDDNPPPLEDMTEVLEKMHLDTGKQSIENICPMLQSNILEENIYKVSQKPLRRTEDKTSLVSITPNNPILITNDVSKAEPKVEPKVEPPLPSKPLEPLKRGFLNATSKQLKPKLKAQIKEDIPFIRPPKSKEKIDNIPDFMRVQDPKRSAFQKEVQEMLKPTQEIVKDVMETTDIKVGLEDPEIMAAVSEIAGNPDAVDKYKNNKKITLFYDQLGMLMKDRMDKQDKKINNKV